MLGDELQKKGVRPLIWADYGFVQFANNKKLCKTPADFEGMKIRGYSKYSSETIKAIGASSERVVKSFPGSIIVEYPENASALHAVETGEADYAICGNLTTAYYMTHTDDDNCLQVVGHSERQDDLVVYAEKGNQNSFPDIQILQRHICH